ncbi:hypothetical protein F4604DRAFT_1932529 [Suillus subluteus]|nr:hypothetical protein F4604DRAFT_1932529 [Suillus subluteus]
MTMMVGFLSLPTELTCHILALLNPKDINRCAMTCNTFCIVVRNSAGIQYKLIYAQGLISTEIATMHSNGISGKMCSLKKLASLWRSDFQANTIFETVVATASNHTPNQSMKCGCWWTDLTLGRFCIQDCSTHPELSRAWSINDLFPQPHSPRGFIAFDPLQDLMVVFSPPHHVTVTDAEQDHHIFLVESRLASSQRPHVNASPIIRGDRVFVFYYTEDADHDLVSGVFIQVIKWRKGYANSGLMGRLNAESHHLPKSCHDPSLLGIVIHAHPSFHGTAAHLELMPSYVPSLESQIMVLEFFSTTGDTIPVIDMVVFSDMALHSDMPVKVSWSDWGSQHVYYFPHNRNSHISVFGSKMAYTLPQDRTPDPGQRLEGPSAEGYFYVHIWDFSKRVIARSESINDPNSPDFFICKPA